MSRLRHQAIPGGKGEERKENVRSPIPPEARKRDWPCLRPLPWIFGGKSPVSDPIRKATMQRDSGGFSEERDQEAGSRSKQVLWPLPEKRRSNISIGSWSDGTRSDEAGALDLQHVPQIPVTSKHPPGRTLIPTGPSYSSRLLASDYPKRGGRTNYRASLISRCNG